MVCRSRFEDLVIRERNSAFTLTYWISASRGTPKMPCRMHLCASSGPLTNSWALPTQRVGWSLTNIRAHERATQ